VLKPTRIFSYRDSCTKSTKSLSVIGPCVGHGVMSRAENGCAELFLLLFTFFFSLTTREGESCVRATFPRRRDLTPRRLGSRMTPRTSDSLSVAEPLYHSSRAFQRGIFITFILLFTVTFEHKRTIK